jgi:hypothetical protein
MNSFGKTTLGTGIVDTSAELGEKFVRSIARSIVDKKLT